MIGAQQGKFIEPAIVVSHFHLRPGDAVADFGAGSGHYMQPLAKAVSAEGKVYLCEIQKELVEALGHKAHDAHFRNVHPLWCDVEMNGGVPLSDGVLDAGLVSNTLFQFIEKEKAINEIARVLRSGAKLFVIDWTDAYGGLGPHPQHVVTEEEAKKLFEECGFVYERSFPAGAHHYGLAFRKR